MASRYGCRQVLYEQGFEIPYEMVPDGIRGPIHDVYPCPGIKHFWNFTYIFWGSLLFYKIGRTLQARQIFKVKYPKPLKWRTPRMTWTNKFNYL